MNDELVATAEIGERAREFVESDLGQVLLGLAEQAVIRAQEALGEVNPTDTDAIRALQNEVKLGKRFEAWLIDLIQDGENAMEIFKNERDQK